MMALIHGDFIAEQQKTKRIMAVLVMRDEPLGAMGKRNVHMYLQTQRFPLAKSADRALVSIAAAALLLPIYDVQWA